MPKIRTLRVEPVRITPAEASLLVHLELDGPAAGVELRGKLIGPRCEGVSTVEVAYPLRPVSGASDTALTLRIVIPEPNLWSAEAPFRYESRVEVWQGGVCEDTQSFVVELRRANDEAHG